ncbi:MAG: ferrous iron transport protein A [Clostridiales bacterium]|jgi:Fe2+ transport system protein FeoA|nr:ferrous iron transport protein A [Clostridiales bacterium]
MEKSLDQFTAGERGRVLSISAEGTIRRRLFDMGVTPGVELVMKRTAPLGDPIQISLRGYELSMRKSEAVSVKLKVEN